MVKKSIYIGFSQFFFKLSQKIDLNMSEYVEFYGDHVFFGPNDPKYSPNINFYQFYKKSYFLYFLYFLNPIQKHC